MTKSTKVVATQDYEDAIAAVDNYIEGMRIGSADRVREAFRDDAVMFGYMGAQLLAGPIKNLFDYVGSSGKAPDIKARLDVVEITPTTAVVRSDVENDATGSSYTDWHSLVKIEGTWLIVSKIFRSYDA